MIYKGLIIGFDGNNAIVVTDDRQYLRIRRENSMYIGEKLTFDSAKVIKRTAIPAKFMSIAACILIFLGIILFLNPINLFMTSSKEYAIIDIDINPSIEFVLNKNEKVLRVIPLNDDAKSFAEGSVLTGKHMDESLKILLGRFNENGLSKDDKILMISASLKNEQKEEKLDNLIKSLKTAANSFNNGKLKIVTVKAELKDLKESRKRKISIGKSVLIENIKSKVSNINVEEVTNMSLNDIVQMYLKVCGKESSSIDIDGMILNIMEAKVTQRAAVNSKMPTPTAVQKVMSTPKVTAKATPDIKPTAKMMPTPTSIPEVKPTSPKPAIILNGIISGKYYRITAKHSGRVITVTDSSMKEGADIVQKTFTGGGNQLWKIEPAGGNYYKITSKHSGKCLSVKDSGLNNGVGLVQLDYTGEDNQLFAINEVEPGYYAIFVKHTGKCADVVAKYTDENVTVWQWDYLSGDNQKWKISD